MKRYIRSSENSTDLTMERILQILKDHGIDTTPHKYELSAETYERYESGRKYRKKFTTDGDYLAYFSMLFHKKPRVEDFQDYYDDFEEFSEFVDENPTVADIKDFASSVWYGDGDDFIFYLKNLDSNRILYESDYEEDIVDEDDE